MYKLEYLPSALRDMTEIAQYISAKLKAPAAAENLAEELVDAAERAAAFPYSNPAYIPIRPLKREYRKRALKNYLIFYYADEERKIVTIARVIYARRELGAAFGKERRGAEEP